MTQHSTPGAAPRASARRARTAGRALRVDLVSEHASPLAALGGVDAGGQNVHVASLAAALSAQGHDVTVHTRRDDPGTPAVVEHDGYRVHQLDAGPPRPLPKDDLLPLVGDMAAGLARWWSGSRPDVVHAHFWMSGLAAATALDRLGPAGAARPPLVQTFHALGTVKRAHQGEHDTSARERVALEAGLARRVDHVLATASEEAAELARWGVPAGRVTVVPCGVDLAAFAGLPAPPRCRLVLSLGRLVPRKGVADAVRALADVPDARLTVAGGPPGEALAADPEAVRLRALAADLGVGDRVDLVGAVRRAAVPGLVAAHDVVVCAPWYEPFGIVPLEAMAAGRPVVGSDVGGLRDTVVPSVTGLLVPPRSPRALAAALTGLLDDPDRAAAMGAAGRRRACDHYGWDLVAARTAEVYAGLLAGAAARPVAADHAADVAHRVIPEAVALPGAVARPGAVTRPDAVARPATPATAAGAAR